MCPLMSKVSSAATDVSPCSAASGRAPRIGNTTTRRGRENARPVFLENIGACSPLKAFSGVPPAARRVRSDKILAGIHGGYYRLRFTRKMYPRLIWIIKICILRSEHHLFILDTPDRFD